MRVNQYIHICSVAIWCKALTTQAIFFRAIAFSVVGLSRATAGVCYPI